MHNSLTGGLAGAIMPVNPKYEAVAGVSCCPGRSNTPKAPDLAVLCTPPQTISGLVSALDQCGTIATIVLTACLALAPGDKFPSLQEQVPKAAKPHLISPDDVRFRFFGSVRDFAHSELDHYRQID